MNIRWDNQQLVVVMDEPALRQAPRYEGQSVASDRGAPAASPATDPARPRR